MVYLSPSGEDGTLDWLTTEKRASTERLPLIALTMGDPAGIGPEIVARAATNEDLRREARLLVLGNSQAMRRALSLVGTQIGPRVIHSPSEGRFQPDCLEVIDPTSLDFSSLKPGVVQGDAGLAAYDCIRKAIELALNGEADAIATAPINKEALHAAGVPYIDHTAMLASLAGSADPMTMFVLDNLRIFFLTRHLPLIEACRQVTFQRVLTYLHRVDVELRSLGIASPRIAVAGLNPHSGEGGLFGTEEIQELSPAVAEAQSRGIDVQGPVPADSVFFLCRQGKYDAVLSLYHDQGHIAAKTVDFERTVSVTLGLPFLRTSVDHGTAFDLAWKGRASSTSMEESIRVAVRYLRHA